MDKEIQKQIDELKKLKQGNRARSKKYLDKIKAQGKRQVSIILNDATIDTLTRLRDESQAARQIKTYGDIITDAINYYVNIDKKETKKNVIKNIKSDVKDFSHGNAGTNRELYNLELDKILSGIEPGHWKREAELLNKRGIKTAKGLPWTAENLRFTYNKKIK